MEKFKAVEKEMKTKAYSKEGLSAAMKLDPKEKEKLETCQFLSNMVDELDRQIETVEAETESLNATVKKGKKDGGKSDRIAELERITERHKWHQGKLELLLRALENGQVEVEQVKDLQESIKYYVDNNQEVDFMEDDSLYDDLNLEEEEDLYGMNNDADRVSSQDTQSIQDEPPDGDAKVTSAPPAKQKTASTDTSSAAARRPSTHTKSPLPALATLHMAMPTSTTSAAPASVKPAPIPTRAGEPLKYASAAAAAAASDKNNVGIAPLPPPPGAATSAAATAQRSGPVASPSTAPAQPSSTTQAPGHKQINAVFESGEGSSSAQSLGKSPALSHSSVALSTVGSSIPATPALEKVEGAIAQAQKGGSTDDVGNNASGQQASNQDANQDPSGNAVVVNGKKDVSNGGDHESVYHLPASLQDLIDSFEATKSRLSAGGRQIDERMLALSQVTCPQPIDAERPRHYRPKNPYPYAPSHYPQEPHPIFNDTRLYSRVDIDTLFYTFYFRQGTYEQYLAARALKSQSWRFHKQYQTWFQRHEEPKSITEEYEQGTYRFFDYESTW